MSPNIENLAVGMSCHFGIAPPYTAIIDVGFAPHVREVSGEHHCVGSQENLRFSGVELATMVDEQTGLNGMQFLELMRRFIDRYAAERAKAG